MSPINDAEFWQFGVAYLMKKHGITRFELNAESLQLLQGDGGIYVEVVPGGIIFQLQSQDAIDDALLLQMPTEGKPS